MKKKLLLFIIPLISNSILAFQKIDTTQIKKIRYEWKVSNKTNDSILTSILTEYESGIFKLKHQNKNKLNSGGYFIYGSDYIDKGEGEILISSTLVMKIGNIVDRNYYDHLGNLDSLCRTYIEDSIKKSFTIRANKKYKRNNKLEYLIDVNGNRNIYDYSFFFGKLRQVRKFNDSILIKISEFENSLLTKETFPTRKKYNKQFVYQYDDKKRLVKRNDDHYHFYRYYYSKYGISKIEKVFKKLNFVKKIITFEYHGDGNLKEKNVTFRSKVSQGNTTYIYTYK